MIPLAEKRQTRICGTYVVTPFLLPHENIPNTAFIIQFPNGEKMLYATDFMYIPFSVASWDINHFLVAVNHTMDIPEGTEAREHRIKGHSSLETVKDFLRSSMTDKCKTVTACHLSGTYSDEDLILRELTELCGDNVQVSIARKGETIDL